MSRRLDGRNALSYRGVNPLSPPELVIVHKAPTSRDFKNYTLGTIWLDVSGGIPTSADIYMLVSVNEKILAPGGNPTPVAVWVSMAALPPTDQSLTGDTGLAVFPDATQRNIDLNSGIFGLQFDGVPATSTIKLNVAGGQPLLQSLSDDVGTLTYPDASGNVEILGTAGRISTTAAVNEIVVDVDSSVAGQFTTNSGVAAPAMNNLNVVGGVGIDTSAPGTTDIVQVDTKVTVANTFTTDSGNATPASHILKVLGGTNISTSGATNTITVGTNSGAARCSFLVFFNGFELNVTGDGTEYIVPFDTTVFNTGSSFNTTTHTFTAPIDGVYLFTITWTLGNCGVFGNTFDEYTRLVTTTATPDYYQSNSRATSDGDPSGGAGAGAHQETNTYMIKFLAGETAYFKISATFSGGPSKTMSFIGNDVSDPRGIFAGTLLM